MAAASASTSPMSLPLCRCLRSATHCTAHCTHALSADLDAFVAAAAGSSGAVSVLAIRSARDTSRTVRCGVDETAHVGKAAVLRSHSCRKKPRTAAKSPNEDEEVNKDD